jgi:hypothetical protein
MHDEQRQHVRHWSRLTSPDFRQRLAAYIAAL